MGRREIVERVYAAFVDARLEDLEPRLDPEVEFVNPADALEPGTRRGPEAFLAVIRQLHDLFDYDSAEIVDWTEGEDRGLAVVRFVGRGKGSGAPMDQCFAHLFEFRGERVVRLHWFNEEGAGRAAMARSDS